MGVDPGMANVGYGIVKKIKRSSRSFKCLGYGLIKTAPSSPPAERLKKINNELSKLIKEYQPNALAVEKLYFFRNLKTAIPVSQATGVILLTAAKNKIPAFQFTPLEAKLAVTGFGWTEKEVLQKKVKKVLGLKEKLKSDDVADALAIALTCLIKRT